jgi:hypothetical protein
MTTGWLILLALLESHSPAIQRFLQVHHGLEVARATGAACPAAPSTSGSFPSALELDLNGDKRADSAFVVRSKEQPHRFGVVVLNATDTDLTEEHWVVPLRVQPIVGLAEFPSPYGQWLIVLGCTKRDGGTYSWNGKAYVPTPVL